jgi:hypothetical protein
MAAILAAALLLQAPDAMTVESNFRALLERTEKAGLTVPDLPDGAAALQKLLDVSKNLPKDLRDRYAVVRAQSAVLASLHALLVNRKGGLMDMPVTAGKPVPVKIVEAARRGVRVSRQEGEQEIAYSDLDAEWVLAAARPGFAGLPDPSLLAGLWLAKAARWDAAFLAFANVDTDHPLAAESRKRGLEVAVAALDSIVKGKRWTEALARLDTFEKLAPGDGRLKAARDKLLDAMVEHGKELCRKNSKGPMKDVIDLITKHFPDGASRIEDIREANRWIRITDPKRFRLEGAKAGAPWLIDPGDKPGVGMYFVPDEKEYEGIQITVRFDKGSKAHGGVAWKNGSRVAWINADQKFLGVGQGKPRESIHSEIDKDVQIEGRHTITVRIRDGEYVVHYNGVEAHRMKADDSRLTEFGLHVSFSRVWFDEVWLLKKE